MIFDVQRSLAGHSLKLETGRWAQQADGAIVVTHGDTVVLCTATMRNKPREGIDFFPLSVDLEEKTYAAGKIPGSFLRRESRPPDSAILAARLTDRPLRPLFPKGLANDVQIINTLLSSDKENHEDVLGIVGASAALTISRIPFGGPIGAVRVGYDGDRFVVNPTRSFQNEHPLLDLIIVGTRDGVVMLEAGAAEMSESKIIEAIEFGFAEIQPLIEMQDELRSRCGVEKAAYEQRSIPAPVKEDLAARFGDEIRSAVLLTDSDERSRRLDDLKQRAAEGLAGVHSDGDVSGAFGEVVEGVTREAILKQSHRPDGRGLDELRPLSGDVGVLPRPHGTAVFKRGDTQCLSVVTLGSGRDEQRIGLDNLGLEPPKRFYHHYNMPPFASGEAYPLRGPRRREIGHGMLAERAIAPVIPSQEEFPYTIRAVSEILSSNGSTSMAATTATSLALMDAGVPISRPVTGISIGMVMDGPSDYVLLADIQGAEDHFGDMDFKVAGTDEGVTAIQLDIKVQNLPMAVVREAVELGRSVRLRILEMMREVIPGPRAEVSLYAPKMLTHKIDASDIGQIIGPGGRVIRRIEEETGAQINIDEDGTITVAGENTEGAGRALQMIKDITGEPEIGRTVMGKVVRIMDFGAFVEIAPGRDGLVHISELAEEHVNRVEDIVSVGDDVMVKIIEVDDLGRVNLSRKAVLQGDDWVPRREPAGARRGGPPPGGGGRNSRGPRGGGPCRI
jgi:polyribonucleotide nucleotidyltransferase